MSSSTRKRAAALDATPSTTSDTATANNAPAVEPLYQPLAPPALSATGQKIPAAFRFVFIVVVSYVFSAAAHETAAYWIGSADLRVVSREISSTWFISLVLIGRLVELWIPYYFELDAFDAASLTFLTHVPTSYLIRTFYFVPAVPTVATLLLSTTSTFIPFYILYQRSPQFANVLTRRLVPLQGVICILAAMLYALPILAFYYTSGPLFMALHFDRLRTLQPAHSANIWVLTLLLLPMGLLATSFLFSPIASPVIAAKEAAVPLSEMQRYAEKAARGEFDPISASLGETIAANFPWLFRPRAQELRKRMTLLFVSTVAGSAAFAWGEIAGTDSVGALGWGLLWGVSSLLCATILGWVADVW